MHWVRTSVRENTLSNPALVTEQHYIDYITQRGKGWVCEVEAKIVGFAIADLTGNNIWALFVHPNWEGKGIGQKLHITMLHWYFGQTNTTVWLGTAPHTKAEKFYRKEGWLQTGMHGDELKFEMNYDQWKALKQTTGA
mgnify:FL=1